MNKFSRWVYFLPVSTVLRWATFLAVVGTALLLVYGCTTVKPVQPVSVQAVERVVEVQVPCAAEAPARPEPIERIDEYAVDAVRQLAAKLLEFVGPGGYVDQSEAAIDSCSTAN